MTSYHGPLEHAWANTPFERLSTGGSSRPDVIEGPVINSPYEELQRPFVSQVNPTIRLILNAGGEPRSVAGVPGEVVSA